MIIQLKALFECMFYGVMPYWVYEKEKHYRCSYFTHLVVNLKYALCVIKFKNI